MALNLSVVKRNYQERAPIFLEEEETLPRLKLNGQFVTSCPKQAPKARYSAEDLPSRDGRSRNFLPYEPSKRCTYKHHYTFVKLLCSCYSRLLSTVTIDLNINHQLLVWCYLKWWWFLFQVNISTENIWPTRHVPNWEYKCCSCMKTVLPYDFPPVDVQLAEAEL